MKSLSLVLTLLVSVSSFALSSYYDNGAIGEFKNGRLEDDRLLSYVGRVASKNFKPLGYKKNAKKELFGNVDLEKDQNGFFIYDVYCGFRIDESTGINVGPHKVPKNEVMNVEHTWPQSKGAKAEPARGDLHHLFPTDSRANSSRGNHPFGEVNGGKDAHENCDLSKRGNLADPQTGRTSTVYGFQPPVEHRGNVARAMFYVSAKYNYKITEIEEYYLRKWHREDPVDANEISRNNKVEGAQGNRNPFIDFPELVSRISNF